MSCVTAATATPTAGCSYTHSSVRVESMEVNETYVTQGLSYQRNRINDLPYLSKLLNHERRVFELFLRSVEFI